jgi:hypothetical protein
MSFTANGIDCRFIQSALRLSRNYFLMHFCAHLAGLSALQARRIVDGAGDKSEIKIREKQSCARRSLVLRFFDLTDFARVISPDRSRRRTRANSDFGEGIKNQYDSAFRKCIHPPFSGLKHRPSAMPRAITRRSRMRRRTGPGIPRASTASDHTRHKRAVARRSPLRAWACSGIGWKACPGVPCRLLTRTPRHRRSGHCSWRGRSPTPS